MHALQKSFMDSVRMSEAFILHYAGVLSPMTWRIANPDDHPPELKLHILSVSIGCDAPRLKGKWGSIVIDSNEIKDGMLHSYVCPVCNDDMIYFICAVPW